MARKTLEDNYGSYNNPATFRGGQSGRAVELVVYPDGTVRPEYVSSDVKPNSAGQLERQDARKAEKAKADRAVKKRFDWESWRDFMLTQAGGAAAAGALAVGGPMLGNAILAGGDKAAGYALSNAPGLTAAVGKAIPATFAIEGARNFFSDNGYRKTLRLINEDAHPLFEIAPSAIGDILDASMIAPTIKETINLGKSLNNFKFSTRLNNNFNLIKSDVNSRNIDLTDDEIYNLALRKTFDINPIRWHNEIGERLRYTIGKHGKFKNAELPMLFRKYKNTDKGNFNIITDKKGNIILNNEDTRFAFDNGTGNKAYSINTTSDIDVRPHSAGEWESGSTFIFPAKTLFGKKIISTRPSDTFIDFSTKNPKLAVSSNDLQFTTGSRRLIEQAKNAKIKTITTDDIIKQRDENLFKELEAEIDYQNTKAKAKSFGKIPLAKRKLIDWTHYGKNIRDLNRKHTRNPTLEDYKFMDYVFDPIFKSDVISSDYFKSIKSINELKQNSKIPIELKSDIGDEMLRKYFIDKTEWENVYYSPATKAEGIYRKYLNIDEIPD